jgi:hypothetical protein
MYWTLQNLEDSETKQQMLPCSSIYLALLWYGASLALPALVAIADDKVPVPRIEPRPAMASCDSGDEVPIPRPLLSCPSSTSCPFVRSRCALQACGRCPRGCGKH